MGWTNMGLGAAVGRSGCPTKEEYPVIISAECAGAPYQSPGDLATFSSTWTWFTPFCSNLELNIISAHFPGPQQGTAWGMDALELLGCWSKEKSCHFGWFYFFLNRQWAPSLGEVGVRKLGLFMPVGTRPGCAVTWGCLNCAF